MRGRFILTQRILPDPASEAMGCHGSAGKGPRSSPEGPRTLWSMALCSCPRQTRHSSEFVGVDCQVACRIPAHLSSWKTSCDSYSFTFVKFPPAAHLTFPLGRELYRLRFGKSHYDTGTQVCSFRVDTISQQCPSQNIQKNPQNQVPAPRLSSQPQHVRLTLFPPQSDTTCRASCSNQSG